MISVEKAKEIILTEAIRIKNQRNLSENVFLAESLARVTTSPIQSPISVPLFDNSAMDGFALCSGEGDSLKIVGEIKAGDPPIPLQEPQSCLRIMTGAPLPPGADTVVKKEDVVDNGKMIQLSRSISSGENVRRKGEDFQAGDIVLPSGTRMTPGVIGILASLGIQKVEVTVKPRVAIIATGHELASSLESLKPGQIIESNSVMLQASLLEMGMEPVVCEIVEDDPKRIQSSLMHAVENSDVVIITGGVSVGEHDHTRQVLHEIGVQEHFWKVNQKPGKPFCFGTIGQKLIFGLPGNPYAVFVCFYLYIRPALLMMTGDPHPELRRERLKLACSISKKDDRTHFLKGRKIPFQLKGTMGGQAGGGPPPERNEVSTAGGGGEDRTHCPYEAEPLKGQGSHLLRALRDADVIIQIPAEKKEIKEGEEVEVIFLP